MDVEVEVNWKSQRTDDGCDAQIDISCTTIELVENNRFDRQELGAAADETRVNELNRSGVNHFAAFRRA